VKGEDSGVGGGEGIGHAQADGFQEEGMLRLGPRLAALGDGVRLAILRGHQHHLLHRPRLHPRRSPHRAAFTVLPASSRLHRTLLGKILRVVVKNSKSNFLNDREEIRRAGLPRSRATGFPTTPRPAANAKVLLHGGCAALSFAAGELGTTAAVNNTPARARHWGAAV